MIYTIVSEAATIDEVVNEVDMFIIDISEGIGDGAGICAECVEYNKELNVVDFVYMPPNAVVRVQFAKLKAINVFRALVEDYYDVRFDSIGDVYDNVPITSYQIEQEPETVYVRLQHGGEGSTILHIQDANIAEVESAILEAMSVRRAVAELMPYVKEYTLTNTNHLYLDIQLTDEDASEAHTWFTSMRR